MGRGSGEPENMSEAALLQALQITNMSLSGNVNSSRKDYAIRIKAGPPGLCAKMGEWLEDGRCGLEPKAGSEILRESEKLARATPRTVIVTPGESQHTYTQGGTSGRYNRYYRCYYFGIPRAFSGDN